MAEVTVKLFGVFRSDTHLASEVVHADTVLDVFVPLNDRVDEVYAENKAQNPALEKPDPIRWKDAVVYVNGEKCKHKKDKLSDGDEIWIMSPASGG